MTQIDPMFLDLVGDAAYAAAARPTGPEPAMAGDRRCAGGRGPWMP